MNTYIFTTRLTNSLEITIQAESEDAAWGALVAKIDTAEALGIRLPDVAAWAITTAY